jgi:uncharacterized protein YjgD (DUF1641 family)
MAKAIKQINKSVPNDVDEQAQAIGDIVKALSENRDALLTALGIVKNLQDMGVLTALHALIEQRNEVGAIAVQQMNQPAMHNVMKNGINVFKFLGSVKPEQLQAIFQGLSQGFERSSEMTQKGGTPSLWKLGTSIRDPDVKASLSTMIEFLHGMGEVFNQGDQGKLH